MTRKEAQALKVALKQSDYVEPRSIKIHRYGSEYEVQFAEGGCGYQLNTLAQAIGLGFYEAVR